MTYHRSKAVSALKPQTIHVHPFMRLVDDDQEIITYCDATDPLLTGWSVWVRKVDPTKPDDVFEADDIGDFPSRTAAWKRAGELASQLGVPIEEYC